MKKYLVVLVVLISSQINLCAFAGYSAIMTKIENSFYGIDYAEETDIKRLERLEETVYGEIKQGDVKTRLNKLSSDISADMIGKEIEPSTDTYRDDSPKYSDETLAESMPDSSANYPVIDTMEERIFKQTYKTSDIKNRITHLEKEVFNQIYTNEDLYTRVERLKSSILIEENPMLANYDDVFNRENPSMDDFYEYKPNYENNYENSYANAMPNDFSDKPKMSEKDMEKIIGKLEKKLLKQKYKDDTTEERLSRIEEEMFQTEFAGDDPQMRLERIATAYNAQKASTKYDSNKITRNMSTIMQIGMTVLMILAMVL